MTHVSKKILDAEIEEKLLIQFSKFFSEQEGYILRNLFSELLSPVERIMLVKRLAIIIMLHQKKTTSAIAQTLMVSDSTVRDSKIKMALGHYEHVIKRYENKKFNNKEFIKLLETILSAGLPSFGKDRWESLG